MLTLKQYERVKTLFLEAESLSEDEQTRLAMRASLEDPDVGDELKRLLALEPASSAFLEQPICITDSELFGQSSASARIASLMDDSQPPTDATPIRIGRYTVTRQIGSGGMGTVYEVTQQQPRRTLAVKIIRTGLTSNSALRRFQQEAEVLARLEHDCVAHIYDTGMADVHYLDGSSSHRPFFAMEYIQGTTLTDFAKKHNLNLHQRLALMADICDAVHHAHQKGVIHRDIKPGNILVNENGKPKILDFGIARITDADIQTVTMKTQAGQLVGTIPYMSPEQLHGESDELETRSDIYSLGVVLFELLAGQLPHDVKSCTIPEAIRRIDENDPPLLGSINTTFRGDPETIVNKALEKEKDRRYASAAELAADIRRFLADEPITARPATTTYQLKKFARRNRALVTGITIAFLALILGATISTWQAVRATQETRKKTIALSDAQNARDEAEAAVTFLTSMLTSADPAELGRDVLVTDVLALASQSLDTQWEERPLLEARIHDAVGKTYRVLGEYSQAETHLERALELRKEHLEEYSILTMQSANELAMLYTLQGKLNEADELALDTLEQCKTHLEPGDSVTLQTINALAVLRDHQGSFEEAEDLYRQALDEYEKTQSLTTTKALDVKRNLGHLLEKRGKWQEAETCTRQALEGLRETLGSDHPKTMTAIATMASLLLEQGKYKQALPLHEEVLERRTRVFGEDHPQTLTSMNNMGVLLIKLERFQESETFCRKALEGRQRVLGKEHPQTLTTIGNLGTLLFSRGKFQQAEPLLLENLKLKRSLMGEIHPDTQVALNNVAMLYREMNQYQEAETYARQALEGARQLYGADHPRTITSMTNLGSILRGQGKLEQAEPLYREVLDKSREFLGTDHPDTLTRANNLGLLLIRLKQYDEAEPVLRESMEGYRRAFGDQHQGVGKGLATLAMLETARDNNQKAADLFKESLEIFENADNPNIIRIANVRSKYALILQKMQHFEQAEQQLLNVFETFNNLLGLEHRRTKDTAQRLANLYNLWEKPEKAARYQEISQADTHDSKE